MSASHRRNLLCALRSASTLVMAACCPAVHAQQVSATSQVPTQELAPASSRHLIFEAGGHYFALDGDKTTLATVVEKLGRNTPRDTTFESSDSLAIGRIEGPARMLCFAASGGSESIEFISSSLGGPTAPVSEVVLRRGSGRSECPGISADRDHSPAIATGIRLGLSVSSAKELLGRDARCTYGECVLDLSRDVTIRGLPYNETSGVQVIFLDNQVQTIRIWRYFTD